MVLRGENMSIKQIERTLKANSGGITLDLNGKIPRFKQGYYCSITNNVTPYITLRQINTVIKQAKKKRAYIGYWKDSSSGLEYLDVTVHSRTLERAVEIARTYNQLAIWDIANNKEIRVV